MNSSIDTAKKVSQQLGKYLRGHAFHVVGVFPRPSQSDAQKFELYVYIDSPEDATKVPHEFRGHKVHIESIDTPVFL
jgi:hypothetical protein